MALQVFFLVEAFPGDSTDQAHPMYFDATDSVVVDASPPMVPVGILRVDLLGTEAAVSLARAKGTGQNLRLALLDRVADGRSSARMFRDLKLVSVETKGRTAGRTIEAFTFSFGLKTYTPWIP